MGMFASIAVGFTAGLAISLILVLIIGMWRNLRQCIHAIDRRRGGLGHWEAGVLEAVESLSHLDPDVIEALEGRVTLGQLSEVSGMPGWAIGALIRQLYGVYQQEPGDSYDLEELMRAHKAHKERSS